MEAQEAERKKPFKSRSKKRKGVGPYPFEFRVQSDRIQLEERYSASLITAEMGISTETLNQWVAIPAVRGSRA